MPDFNFNSPNYDEELARSINETCRLEWEDKLRDPKWIKDKLSYMFPEENDLDDLFVALIVHRNRLPTPVREVFIEALDNVKSAWLDARFDEAVNDAEEPER